MKSKDNSDQQQHYTPTNPWDSPGVRLRAAQEASHGTHKLQWALAASQSDFAQDPALQLS